jgi:hypothetical protein
MMTPKSLIIARSPNSGPPLTARCHCEEKLTGNPIRQLVAAGTREAGAARQSIDIDQIMSRSAMISFDLLEEGIEGAPARLSARNGKGIRP